MTTTPCLYILHCDSRHMFCLAQACIFLGFLGASSIYFSQVKCSDSKGPVWNSLKCCACIVACAFGPTIYTQICSHKQEMHLVFYLTGRNYQDFFVWTPQQISCSCLSAPSHLWQQFIGWTIHPWPEITSFLPGKPEGSAICSPVFGFFTIDRETFNAFLIFRK